MNGMQQQQQQFDAAMAMRRGQQPRLPASLPEQDRAMLLRALNFLLETAPQVVAVLEMQLAVPAGFSKRSTDAVVSSVMSQPPVWAWCMASIIFFKKKNDPGGIFDSRWGCHGPPPCTGGPHQCPLEDVPYLAFHADVHYIDDVIAFFRPSYRGCQSCTMHS